MSDKQRPDRVSLLEMIGYISVMAFTFRRIEIFLEAAADGNFRKTADRLGISQPAVSKQIRALERSLNKTLFVRARGAAARLSEEGEAMLASAYEMLARQRQWQPERTGSQLRLKVITGDYLLDSIFKPALPELVRRFPNVSLEFQMTNERNRIVQQIRTGQADLAIYTGGKMPPDLDIAQILSIIPCSLYAAPDLARSLRDDIDAISRAPFILPTTHTTSSWVLSELNKVGIHPKIIVGRTQFGDVLAGMIADGIGVGLLFDDHANICFGARLQRLPVQIESAYRVVIFGERARLPTARECLGYVCSLCTAPDGIPG